MGADCPFRSENPATQPAPLRRAVTFRDWTAGRNLLFSAHRLTAFPPFPADLENSHGQVRFHC